ncbi:hypothetical protein POM88_022234 [Heracleum sosnowskyi]|uniref:Polyprotein n=1 Tax=Heracleum sosnowskyi TaxID=360622 RepID=A0AAD8MTH4_9APIA|nr:hypothetical protein POM88_022234 [Heracleum sosnowskyi]
MNHKELLDDIITEIVEVDTASGLWLKLEGLYMTKSLTNKLLLKQRLFSLRMQEDTISLEEVRPALHSRELRHKAAGTSVDNQAVGLVASKSNGHGKPGKNKFKKPSSKGPKSNDVCNYCKEKGHWKSDCPKKKKQQDKLTGITAVAGTNSEEDIALVAVEHTHHSDVWILNSGASYHVCPRREWFTTYEQADGGKISMANSFVCETVGIGSIKIRTHDGKFCTLNDVRHVPLMTKNLISLSMLDNKGFSFQGKGGVLHVCKGSDVVLKGFKRGTLYLLQGSTLSGSVDVASSEIDKENMTRLWHMRLGFMSIRGMQILSKADLLCGHKVTCLEFCEHCWGPSRWKALLENQTGKKIKRLRTDNGLEFCSSELDEFCKNEGIARHHTVRDTPQHNGVVKRYEHWQAVKRVFQYLKGTSDVGFIYGGDTECLVTGFSDTNYAGDVDSRRSMTGYAFTLGGSIVNWKATLQPTVTLSTTEVEYMALTEASTEGIWLKGLVSDLGLHHDQATVYCDSLSAICLANDQVHHERTKHIDVRYNFLRSEKRIKVSKVGTADNLADMLTKPVTHNKFQHCLDFLNVRSC